MKQLLLLLTFLASAPSLFGYTVSGSLFYTDRLYEVDGFNGTQILPIREADVEVYDINNFQIIAQGATDRNGSFSLEVFDSSARDLKVRVLTKSDNTATLDHRVLSNSGGVYSYSSPATLAGDGVSDIDFSTIILPGSFRLDFSTPLNSIPPESSAFNIYDMGVYLADYIEMVDGVRPFGANKDYRVVFSITSGPTGSSYSPASNTFNCARDDGYDDTNIIHELGHYIEDEYGSSSNTAGSHVIGDDDQDPRLAWSEGLATYVANATLNYANVNRPDIYIDRISYDPDGAPGGFDYDLEVPFMGGSTNEGAVNSALYDLIDSSSTKDASVGVDDEDISGLDSEVWAVLEEMRVLNPPFTSMEDFWDIWLQLELGSVPEVQHAFSLSKVDFLEDQFEPNNRPVDATELPTSGTVQQHSFYREGEPAVRSFDEDWFKFNATSGTVYRIEIIGDAESIYGRPDPEMALIDLESGEVLAFVDDPHDDTLSSTTARDPETNSAIYDDLSDMKETVPSLLFQPTESKDYYLYVRHSAKNVNLGGRYGTYEIRVLSESTPSAPQVDSVSIQKMKPGETYSLLVIGDNFPVGLSLSSDSADLTFSNVRIINSDAFSADVSVDASAPNLTASLTINTPYGESATSDNTLVVSSNVQPPIIITKVSVDTDSVEIRNIGTTSADLSNWSLLSNYSSGFTDGLTFPSDTIIPAGFSVFISENPGSSTDYEYYDPNSSFNWSWTGLSAFTSATGNISLVDAEGDAVDTIRWVRGYVNNTFPLLGNNAKWMQPEFLNPPLGTYIGRSANGSVPRTSIGLSWSSDDLGGGQNVVQTVDAFEENETRRQARLIHLNTEYNNLWIGDKSSYGTDVDWYGVVLDSNLEYQALIQFESMQGDLELEVYAPNSDGQLLGASRSIADYQAVNFITSEGSGIYFIKVFGKTQTDLASYSLSILPTSDLNLSDIWLFQ